MLANVRPTSPCLAWFSAKTRQVHGATAHELLTLMEQHRNKNLANRGVDSGPVTQLVPLSRVESRNPVFVFA